MDTRKIPGMLRKHSSPGSQTEEEGEKRAFMEHGNLYTNSVSHTGAKTSQNFPNTKICHHMTNSNELVLFKHEL